MVVSAVSVAVPLRRVVRTRPRRKARIYEAGYAATFPKETIDRYYGPCTDWTRADLILDAMEKADEQPQPQTSADSSSHIAPPMDVSETLEYREADAARDVKYLKMFMEKLLPDIQESYFLRGVGYKLMADITHLIESGQMDDELWYARSMDLVIVLEQMFESEGFPCGFVVF